MLSAVELRWIGVLCLLGCGPPRSVDSSEPRQNIAPPADDDAREPSPTVPPRAIPRCGPDRGNELTTFSALAAKDPTRHHVVVVHRDGAWLPAEHIDMPMHHATAIQWDNLDAFRELGPASDEQLRFTFTVLSKSREHRAEQNTVFTTFVARVEMICSASAPADRPEGAVFRSMDIGAEQCPKLEAAMVEAGQELGQCTSDAQCTIVETPMCGIEGLGCYWAALNRTRDASPLTEAVQAWRDNPCLAAECDCAGRPTAARCRGGQCVAG